MAETVVKVGVVAFVDSPDEDRERLKRFQELDRAAGAPDDWIEQEVDRESQLLDVRFRAYAQMSSGRRFESRGDSAVASFSVPPVGGRDVVVRQYEELALSGANELAENTQWLYSQLLGLLEPAGIDFDRRELEELPRDAELHASVGEVLARIVVPIK